MRIKKLRTRGGQALIEVLISITLGAIFMASGSFLISAFLISNNNNRNATAAISLSNELMDSVQALADANWLNIYNLAHASTTHYYLLTTGSPYSVVSGDQSVIVNGVSFTRYFYVDNISRDNCGVAVATTSAITACLLGPGNSGVADDPSTQKITAVVTWPQAPLGLTYARYFTRARNRVFWQNNWSGGAGQESFSTTSDATLVNNKFASSTNIVFSSGGALTMSSVAIPAELYSSVFDTMATSGVAINTIMWQGTPQSGGVVKFQLASSNSLTGPWVFLGNDNSSTSYYTPTGPDAPMSLRKEHNNRRYLRYRLRLEATTLSPTVSSIIFNWSP